MNKSTNGPGGENSTGPVLFFALRRIALRILLRRSAPAFILLLIAVPAVAQRWQRLGPRGGNVISLSDSTDGTVYLGTADGHVFASTDQGGHWELRGRAGSRLDGVVQRMIADRSEKNRLLAAVWFLDSAQGGGVFESLDGARHWKLAGLQGEAVRVLEHSESDPRVWVAGTRTGTFRSTDDARTWQRISSADDPELQNVDSLAIDPGNPQIIYVGTYHLPWKTMDGGKTWRSIASGMIDDSDIMSFLIDAKNPQRIFSTACSGIYRSEDAGDSWTKLQSIPYASRRTQQIAQDSKDPRVLYAGTTEGLWRTSDSGENWSRITPRETIANAILLLPVTAGTRILAGMEAQGVLRSDDGGNAFVESNEGFSHRVIASVAADASNPSHLLVRIEGLPGKLFETRDSGGSWLEISGVISATVNSKRSPANLYGSSSNWWLSYAEGGLARFDPAKKVWQAVPFHEMAPGRRSRSPVGAHAAAGSRQKTRTLFPKVNFVLEVSQRLFVATQDGLWVLHKSEFRRVVAKNLPRTIGYLSAGAQNSLLAIADGSPWASDATAAVWKATAAPEGAGRLLWIQEIWQTGTVTRLLGTQNGVFLSSAGGPWRLLANGLPAIASRPLSMAGQLWFLAMNNGGIYRSGDSGKTWQWVDWGREQGTVLMTVPAKNGLVVASQSEGLLRFVADSNAKP